MRDTRIRTTADAALADFASQFFRERTGCAGQWHPTSDLGPLEFTL